MTQVEYRNALGQYVGKWVSYTATVGVIGSQHICLINLHLTGQDRQLCKHVWMPIKMLRQFHVERGQEITFTGKAGRYISLGKRSGRGPRESHKIVEVRA